MPRGWPFGLGFFEVTTAVGLIVYRVSFYPASGFWRDWVLILCLYWIATVFASKSRWWQAVTFATSALLLAIYSSKHVPIILELLSRTT
jgi:hypothetical protein